MRQCRGRWVPVAVLALCFALPLGATSQQEQAPKEDLTIRILPQCDAPVDKDSPLIAWLEKQLDAKFEFMYLERNKKTELLNLRLAAGDIPDVFQAYPDDRLREFIRQGVLRPFTEELVKTSMPVYYTNMKKYGGSAIFNFGKGPDGKLYGNPGVSFNGQYHYTPIWRDDWLKKVGIAKVPETIVEAEKALYAFVNNDPDGNGKKDTYGMSERAMAVVFGAFGGIPPYKATPTPMTIIWNLVDGRIDSSITTKGSREALKLLAKWYKDGVIDPEFITGENKGQYWGNSVTLWNGLIGFSQPGLFYHINPPLFEGDKGSGNYQQFKAIQGAAATYAPGRPLVGPTGLSGTLKFGVVEGSYQVYGKQVSDAKLAKWFAIEDRIQGDPLLWLSVWNGLQGVDWDWDVKEYYTVKSLKPRTVEEQARYGMGSNGIGALEYNCWDQPWGSSNALRQPIYQYGEKVGKFPITGYPNLVWGTLPSAATYKAAVEKMSVEYYTAFITGEKNVNDDKTWNDFTAAINAAGLTVLTREAQEWYDRVSK